jgi:AraC-like DNA-binding protein
MWSLDLLNWILGMAHISSPDVYRWVFTSSLFVNLAFTLIVTYKGLAQSVSFSGIQAPPKYAASRLTPSDCDDIARKLAGLMETDKPYLSPSISLDEISEKLGIPSRSLSQVIHTRFNQNFFDFINSYRIEDIKKRMHDQHSHDFTLVAIAFDAGFNSKSVFNAAFKKRTGMTPKEYREQC